MLTVATSGGFDPVHIGHLEYLRLAKFLGDYLVVIVNSDEFLIRKKGFAFMPWKERMEIVANLRYVDSVVACVDQDQSVCETLKVVRPDVFAKGGDRTAINTLEYDLCKELGIRFVDGLGNKIQSSSDLAMKIRNMNIGG